MRSVVPWCKAFAVVVSTDLDEAMGWTDRPSRRKPRKLPEKRLVSARSHRWSRRLMWIGLALFFTVVGMIAISTWQYASSVGSLHDELGQQAPAGVIIESASINRCSARSAPMSIRVMSPAPGESTQELAGRYLDNLGQAGFVLHRPWGATRVRDDWRESDLVSLNIGPETVEVRADLENTDFVVCSALR